MKCTFSSVSNIETMNMSGQTMSGHIKYVCVCVCVYQSMWPDYVGICERKCMCVSIPFIATHTWVVKMPLTHCSHDDEYEIYLHASYFLFWVLSTTRANARSQIVQPTWKQKLDSHIINSISQLVPQRNMRFACKLIKLPNFSLLR